MLALCWSIYDVRVRVGLNFLDATASLVVGMSQSNHLVMKTWTYSKNFDTQENLLLFQIVNFGKMTAIISDYSIEAKWLQLFQIILVKNYDCYYFR